MTAKKCTLSFSRGFGFGLSTRTAILDVHLPFISSDNANFLTQILQRQVQVADGTWDAMIVPESPGAGLFCQGYLGIAAQLRQIIGLTARQIDVGTGNAAALTLALPYDDRSVASEICNGLVNWLENHAALPEDHVASFVTALAQRQMTKGKTGLSKNLLAMHSIRLGLPTFVTDHGLVVVGQGAKRRMFDGLFTDHTSDIGVRIAHNKSHTGRLLRNAGLPTAPHRLVVTTSAAVTAAAELGFPVVIKPADCEQGAGVANNLRSPDAVRAAFTRARKVSSNIIVERHVQGATHRLLVVHGEVVRAVRRLPGGVTGNGRDTIEALIDQHNADPARQRRQLREGKPALRLDREALDMLRGEGLVRSSVPVAGQFVALRARDNYQTGGTNTVLDLSVIHPDNQRLAQTAAQAIMLDIAGIDLIIPDITVSWRDQACTICEINANPELGAFNEPHVFHRILRTVVAESGEDCRIPVMLHVVPDPPDQPPARSEGAGAPWYCDAAGLWHQGDFIAGPFADGFTAARAALMHPEVTALDMVMTASEVLSHSLPSDRFAQIRIGALPPSQAAAVAMLCEGHGPVRAD